MKPEVVLEHWSVVTATPYTPPEAGMFLRGLPYGHPRCRDGEPVVTSRVIGCVGRKAETHNTIYALGTPSPEYVEFCKKAGGHVPTDDEPIKVHG